jgi:hypothetical protein
MFSFYNLILIPKILKHYSIKEHLIAVAKANIEDVTEPSNVSVVEKEYELADAKELNYNYLQIIIQYGYVTLFVAACPVIPFLAYISNIIDFREQAWTLLYLEKRYIPTDAAEIGIWFDMLKMTSYVAVITNAAIFCFYIELLQLTSFNKIWISLGFQYFVFTSMQLFTWFKEEIPQEVIIQLERKQYLKDRLEGLNGNENYDKIENFASSSLLSNVLIHQNDFDL